MTKERMLLELTTLWIRDIVQFCKANPVIAKMPDHKLNAYIEENYDKAKQSTANARKAGSYRRYWKQKRTMSEMR